MIVYLPLFGNNIVDHSDAYRRCSNYIFILDLTPGFDGLEKDNCKTRRETFEFWYLVQLLLEISRYVIYIWRWFVRFDCSQSNDPILSQRSYGRIVHINTVGDQEIGRRVYIWYFNRFGWWDLLSEWIWSKPINMRVIADYGIRCWWFTSKGHDSTNLSKILHNR